MSYELRIADLGANRMKKELEARTKRFAMTSEQAAKAWSRQIDIPFRQSTKTAE